MRIDHLTIKNFNGLEFCVVNFNPQFNLIAGDNGSGKTSVLDALVIAIDAWFLGLKAGEPPKNIRPEQVHLIRHSHKENLAFERQFPSRIEVRGLVMGQRLSWARELSHEGGRTTSAEAKDFVQVAGEADLMVRSRREVILPLLCSYGTERLWRETRRPPAKKKGDTKLQLPSRFYGYRDCTASTIQETALLDWIRAEISSSKQRGSDTIALRVVKNAISKCAEGTTLLDYDERYKDLIVETEQLSHQMFRNLSDGQRVVFTLVGDLAKRAITLNPHLGIEVLSKIPGVVLIDELELHLHPNRLRHILHDMKRTFPSIQFITTTHSPKLLAEAQPEEIRFIEKDGRISELPRSPRIDSNRILEELMEAKPRNEEIEKLLSRLTGTD